MKLPFTKMHGTGNDFVVIDCLERSLPNPSEIAQRILHRRFGVGGDQMLLILPAPTPEADFRMAIFNADGSEVEMCGNGIRCFAKWLRDRGKTTQDTIRVHTDAGIVIPAFEPSGQIRVDMGQPELEGERIPTLFQGRVLRQPLEVIDRTFEITCVSMGNPHCVIFVDDVANFPVEKYGPATEHHSGFPKRINTEYIEVIDPTHLKMRVWERGSGETMACGTGASAALVAAVLNDRAERRAEVHLKGGVLLIEWSAQDNHVYMTGPAVEVFHGEVDLSAIASIPASNRQFVCFQEH